MILFMVCVAIGVFAVVWELRHGGGRSRSGDGYVGDGSGDGGGHHHHDGGGGHHGGFDGGGGHHG